MSNFILTKEQLAQLLPGNPYLDHWHHALEQALPDYDINTPQRVAAFVAQCAHESGGFRALKENLNYKAVTLRKIFPKYFPNDAIANQYASLPNKQEAIANRVYGGRMGNGAEASGDGYKFRGRGVLQLTGRANYTQCSRDLFGDDTLANDPDLVRTPEYAIITACWFWYKNKLNEICDTGDIVLLSKRINGGTIGLEDRIKHWNDALEVFEG